MVQVAEGACGSASRGAQVRKFEVEASAPIHDSVHGG